MLCLTSDLETPLGTKAHLSKLKAALGSRPDGYAALMVDTVRGLHHLGIALSHLLHVSWGACCVCRVRQLVDSGALGEVLHFHGEICLPMGEEVGRLYNTESGGGALLDIGLYMLTLASWTYGCKKPEEVKAVAVKHKSGVDVTGGISLRCVSAQAWLQQLLIIQILVRLHVPSWQSSRQKVPSSCGTGTRLQTSSTSERTGHVSDCTLLIMASSPPHTLSIWSSRGMLRWFNAGLYSTTCSRLQNACR